MSDPLVSIIMPTYNQARWLPAALASIEAQTFTDYELIVVDDASIDETPDILEAKLGPFNHYTHASNRGAAAAINTGARGARGRYMTWVSSDNEMRPEWLSELVWVLGDPARPRVFSQDFGAAYGGFTWQRPGEPGHYLFEAYEPERLISHPDCYIGPAFLIRADVWREAGEHRGKISHDYDHWLRVEEVCWRRRLRIAGIDKDLCLYHAHDERATEVRRAEYDAPEWRQLAFRRRGL